MCYHKTLHQTYRALTDHYEASIEPLFKELEPIKGRLVALMEKDEWLAGKSLSELNPIGQRLIEYSQKDALPSPYTKQELSELKWCQKALSSFHEGGVSRFYENGFDHLPVPIITAGTPQEFKLFNWGLIPFYVDDQARAMLLRTQTLNCISEEMYEKPSFRDAAKNAQRCLIPVSGFFEWRWLDEQGTIKIPYYVTFRDQEVRSIGGLYSRWKNKDTGEYYYSYTVLTTPANSIMEYVHNSKKRMPVFIAKKDEKEWLNRDLKKEDVLELCRPSDDKMMRAYTISKLLTTRNVNANVQEVLAPMNYQEAIQDASRYLAAGDKKLALETFKNIVSAEKAKVDDLEHAARQEIKAELEF